MQLKRFIVGPYQSNSYLLYKGYEAMIIDCGLGSEVKDIIYFLEANGIVLTKIYITHGHIDHVGGVNKLKSVFKDATVYAPIKDRYWYMKNNNTGLLEDVKIDKYVKKGDVIYFLNAPFKVIETPGHSYGSTCLYYSQVLFSGDTLFKGSIGRTDLYLGNFSDLIISIKNKLFILPENTTVFPGHGEPTTIKEEILTNPFLKE